MRRDELSIPIPCQVDWDTMTPAGRARFCGECRTHVHDLSRLREAEARALLGSRADLCVRYVVDELGAIRFANEALVPAASLVKARRVAVAALAVATLAACGPRAPEPAYGRPSYTPSLDPNEMSDAGPPVGMPEKPPR